tara:strand:- start:160 stop:2787 length:2628 start_codon:yes stop_codon:yes gene_type:complete
MAELKTILIDDLPYNIPANRPDLEKKLRAEIKSGRGEKAKTHNLRLKAEQQGVSLRQLREEEERIIAEDDAKSGVYIGFLNGLTNNDALGVQFLYERRFPELAAEGVPAENFYFYDKDQNLSYIDPTDGKAKREFDDLNNFMAADDALGWLGPAISLVLEGVLGSAAMTTAAISAAPSGPLGMTAAAAGAGGVGSGIGRTAGDGIRAGISYVLDGPPLSADQFYDDLKMAGAFGAIPIGAGISRPASKFLQSTRAKFSGKDGKTILKALLTEGGETADEIIDNAKSRYGIDLTRAEATGLKTNAREIQEYLSQQATSQRIFDFYQNRALRMEEALDEFFDELKVGRYADRKIDPTKAAEASESTVIDDVQDAYEKVIENLTEERRQRSKKMYELAFDQANKDGLQIDINDILDAEINKQLSSRFVGKERKKALQKVLDTLKSPAEFPSTKEYISTLDGLDEAVKDLGILYEGLLKQSGPRLAAPVARVKAAISKRLEAASEDYRKARSTWSEDTGNLGLLEKGFLAGIGRAIATGDSAKTTKAINDMFTGTAAAADIRTLKEALIEQDPQVWQTLKAHWLRTQLSEAVTKSADPFGTPNRFLTQIGIRNPQAAFATRGGRSRRTKKINAFREILDPQEFENFKDILEVTQAVGYVSSRIGSPTQKRLALSEAIEQESRSASSLVKGALQAAIQFPQRLVVRGFDDIATAQTALQKEAYEDVLIAALLDGEKAAELADALRSINPFVQFMVQSAAKGVESFPYFEEMTPGDVKPSSLPGAAQTEEGLPKPPIGEANVELARQLEEMRRKEAEQKAPEISDPLGARPPLSDIFSPLPETPGASPSNFIDSPTLLPSDQDRELARRLQGGIGGLGAIA